MQDEEEPPQETTIDVSGAPSDGNGFGEGEGEGEGGGGGGSLSPGGDDISGDGYPLSGGLPEGDPSLIYSVLSDSAGHLYLREQSYGNYTGRSWTTAPAYEQLFKDEYAASYLTSYYLNCAGTSPHLINIRSYTGLYALPYYTALGDGLHQVQTSDTSYSGNTDEIYSALFYLWNDDLPSDGYSGNSFENKYREFVYQNYLAIDDETLAYMNDLIGQQGFSKDDPEIINSVARYIQQAASYNLDYDRTLDVCDNIAIAFLSEYREGVCIHYATAATLLYRALGIPARFTVGAVVDAQADQWVDVMSNKAHAWVEVYIDGIGWIQVEVTGGSSSNETYEKEELTLSLKTASKPYDGTPLYPDTTQLSGFEKLEQLGFSYIVYTNSYQIEPGISESIIESITIFDSWGNDVTASFDITFEPGKLHVYTDILTLSSSSYTKVYDGYRYDPDISILDGTLRDGDYITTEPTVKEEVGVWQNTFTVCIYDSNGNDVTSYYLITRQYGKVTVLSAQLTLKANDASKTYDGTALTCDGYTIVDGQLIAGHQIVDVVYGGSQTNIGRSECKIISYRIIDADGNDVTANYSVGLQVGKLRILSD